MFNLLRRLCNFFYRRVVAIRANSVGTGLRVQGFSIVSPKTILGNNVSFNGIKVSGGRNVRIGVNFHSWKMVLIFSQNHNYQGNKLPYDSTYIKKDVEKGDNVWLLVRVIALPDLNIGEGVISRLVMW